MKTNVSLPIGILAEGKDVRHWPENRGTKPMISLAVATNKKP